MSKNVIFCADGTWNGPNEDENGDHLSDPTNVYKLFLWLDGALSADTLCIADEQEKEQIVDGVTRQIAKYIHGVGDSRNPLNKMLGGVFGSGVISRIVRGYTFISRNYVQGDNIYIVGFSRGAYTARALAGLIASQGLLNLELNTAPEVAYKLGAEAWYRYRKSTISNPYSLAHLAEIITDLPAFISQGSLRTSDFIPVDSIAAVAVWDTVGAMGFPEYPGKGKRDDAFKFVDTELSQKVACGFHAVSLDEQRNDFTPTLWDARDGVTQVVFPGAHADVGGGYPMVRNESGLSDNTLQWMVNQLCGAGVQFSDSPTYPVNPDPLGTAHKPWKHAPWNLPLASLGDRSFPAAKMLKDASIAARMATASVIAEPGELSAPYLPTNLPL